MMCNLCSSTEYNYGALFKDKPEMFYTPGRDYCPSCWHPFESLNDPCHIEYLKRSGQKKSVNKGPVRRCVLEIHIFFVKKKFPKNNVYYSNENCTLDS